jgi:hypothetical protein
MSGRMCDFCAAAKDAQYADAVSGALAEDEVRIANSIAMSGNFSTELPLLRGKGATPPTGFPLFECRAAYSGPLRYFQQLSIDGNPLQQGFAQSSTRAIYLNGKNLALFSKSFSTEEGKEFYTSYAHIEFLPSEYSIEMETENRVEIRCECRKTAVDLASGKEREYGIEFMFVHACGPATIMDQAAGAAPARLARMASATGAKRAAPASSRMLDYVVSVPYFAPHPYFAKALAQKFGPSRDAILAIPGYFREHLQKG